jgi:hypothetical protein
MTRRGTERGMNSESDAYVVGAVVRQVSFEAQARRSC